MFVLSLVGIKEFLQLLACQACWSYALWDLSLLFLYSVLRGFPVGSLWLFTHQKLAFHNLSSVLFVVSLIVSGTFMLISLYGIYLPRFKGWECLVFFKSVVLALSTHRPLGLEKQKLAPLFSRLIFLFKLIMVLMLRTEKNEQQHFT